MCVHLNPCMDVKRATHSKKEDRVHQANIYLVLWFCALRPLLMRLQQDLYLNGTTIMVFHLKRLVLEKCFRKKISKYALLCVCVFIHVRELCSCFFLLSIARRENECSFPFFCVYVAYVYWIVAPSFRFLFCGIFVCKAKGWKSSPIPWLLSTRM